MGIKKSKQDVTSEIISEVLGIKVIGDIPTIDIEDPSLYYLSLDKFLTALELEIPLADTVNKKNSFLSRFKFNFKLKKNKTKRKRR